MTVDAFDVTDCTCFDATDCTCLDVTVPGLAGSNTPGFNQWLYPGITGTVNNLKVVNEILIVTYFQAKSSNSILF